MRTALAFVLLLATTSGSIAFDGDPKAGAKVFRKCQACHMVGEDARAKVGPPLNNLFGSTAATNEKFEGKYSTAMVEAGDNGLVWTPEIMMDYLVKPRDYVKGTKMAFAGLKKEEDRIDVIAYLRQFSPDYEASD